MIRRRASLAMTRISSTPVAARLSASLPTALRERLAHRDEPSSIRAEDPSSQMFRHIRTRLTLWFCGALAAMLIVGGALVYFSVQQALLGPVPGYLSYSANVVAAGWQNDFDQHGAPVCRNAPPDALQHVPYIMCIGTDPGVRSYPGYPPPSFVNLDLSQAALDSKDGAVSETIIDTNGIGAIRCYAIAVYDNSSGSAIGVVQVGVPIQGSLDALHALLITLLVIGALTIIGAAIAGRLLAARAMEPAQISFTRQQAFIGDAAHELRTPLTIMRADAEVLLRGRQRLSDDDAELLEDIVSETAHMGALATNLLTLARLDAGRVQLERDVVDFAEIADTVTHRVSALAEERRSAVVIDAHHALTLGDQAQLEQVALILVDNAIKYNKPDGTVTIHTYQDAQRAYFVVQDTGIGIPPESLPHLGERFYRVDKARSREAGGAGLGLSIARGIIAAHGGTLTFASEPGSGAIATVSVPVAK